jgi:type IV pilus assembly protein PilB
MHTNSSTATITRMRNLGVPSYLIASTVNGVVAQRLVRVICQKCRVKYEPSEYDLSKIGSGRKRGDAFFYRGEGCLACDGTGYRSRTGIFEILPFTQQVRDMVASDASETDIRQSAIAGGMVTLARAALDKVKAGVTTLDELYRVVETEEDFGTTCPECNAALGPGFVMCPACGHSLQATCPSCQKIVSPEWKFCPYCRRDFKTPASERSFA